MLVWTPSLSIFSPFFQVGFGKPLVTNFTFQLHFAGRDPLLPPSSFLRPISHVQREEEEEKKILFSQTAALHPTRTAVTNLRQGISGDIHPKADKKKPCILTSHFFSLFSAENPCPSRRTHKKMEGRIFCSFVSFLVRFQSKTSLSSFRHHEQN